MKKLTTIASIISLSIALSACTQHKSVKESVADARISMAERDFNTAVIELKNAVSLEPNNPEYRSLLADSYIEQADYEAAEKELSRAKSLGYASELNIKLALVHLKLGRYEEVIALLDISDELSDEDYLVLLVYSGLAAIEMGNMERAQDYFGQAVSINEEATYGKMAKAYLAQSNSSYATALEIVELVLSDSPDMSEAVLLKANLLHALKSYDAAARVYESYINAKPKAIYVKYFQIDSLLKADKYDEAEIIVDWMLANVREAYLANEYKAVLEYKKGNYREAKQFGDVALQAGNQFLVAKLVVGLSAYQLNELELAFATLKVAAANLPKNHSVHKLLASISLQLGSVGEAGDYLLAADEIIEGDIDFIKFATTELEKSGDKAQAINVLENAIGKISNDELLLHKGLMLLDNDIEQAANDIEKAYSKNPSSHQIGMQLAFLYLKQNKTDKAFGIVNKWKEDSDTKEVAMMLEGLLLQELQKYDEAISVLELIEQKSIRPHAKYYIGNMYNLKGNKSRAIQSYTEVIREMPEHSAALRVLFNMLAHDDPHLTTLLDDYKYSQEFLKNYIRNLVLTNQLELAQGLVQEVLANNQGTSDYEVFSVAAGLALVTGEYDRSAALYKKALALNPSDIRSQISLLVSLMAIHNYEDALVKTEEFLNYGVNVGYFSLIKADIFLNQDKLIEASKIIFNQSNVKQGSLFLTRLKGRLYMKQADYHEAAIQYNKAYSNSKSRIDLYRLVQAYKKTNQYAEATKLLSKHLESNEDDKVANDLLAEINIHNQPAAAKRQYERQLETDPNNIVALNNLAWIYIQDSMPQEALKYAEKAIKLAPSHPKVQDTYGVMLLENEQTENAITWLKKASKGSPQDTEITLHLVDALVINKEIQKAKSILNRINIDEVQEHFKAEYRRLEAQLN